MSRNLSTSREGKGLGQVAPGLKVQVRPIACSTYLRGSLQDSRKQPGFQVRGVVPVSYHRQLQPQAAVTGTAAVLPLQQALVASSAPGSNDMGRNGNYAPHFLQDEQFPMLIF